MTNPASFPPISHNTRAPVFHAQALAGLLTSTCLPSVSLRLGPVRSKNGIKRQHVLSWWVTRFEFGGNVWSKNDGKKHVLSSAGVCDVK